MSESDQAAPLELAPAEIHFWRADLEIDDAESARALSVLAADERARAERFIRPTVRRHFTAGRAFLRRTLARYVHGGSTLLQFSYGLHGKPTLADHADLHFNLSHSGGRAILAVTRRREIGVDLERTRPLANWEGIARRFFSAAEVADLAAVDAAQRVQAFFSCWTRKEAFIKAGGEGMSRPLDQFAVSLRPGEAARLRHVAGDPDEAARWWLNSLETWPGFVACLAIAAPPGPLRHFDFSWPQ